MVPLEPPATLVKPVPSPVTVAFSRSEKPSAEAVLETLAVPARLPPSRTTPRLTVVEGAEAAACRSRLR